MFDNFPPLLHSVILDFLKLLIPRKKYMYNTDGLISFDGSRRED